MGLARSLCGTVVAAAAASLSLTTCGPTLSPADAVMPAHCEEHRPLDGSVDVAGDHHCAGLALDYHLGGIDRSPSSLWAGQWLFTDESGSFRTGWCTYHLGQHPRSDLPSAVVPQSFPLDPDGREVAYLAWRYREVADDVTSAALWAVFHVLAADAGGDFRSDAPDGPLVPSLDVVAAATGRPDVQARAIELLGEARRLAGDDVPEWHLDLTVAAGLSPSEATATVTLMAGDVPVAGQPVAVLVSGGDTPLAATTGTDGSATVAVPYLPGTVTVAATAESPGPAVVYRGTPAVPSPYGAQLLVTAGDPVPLTATATIDAPTASTSTVAGAEPTAPSTEADSLPVAGSSSKAMTSAVAIALLVAGVGLVGTVRRPRATHRPGSAPLGPSAGGR